MGSPSFLHIAFAETTADAGPSIGSAAHDSAVIMFTTVRQYLCRSPCPSKSTFTNIVGGLHRRLGLMNWGPTGSIRASEAQAALHSFFGRAPPKRGACPQRILQTAELLSC
eukprot:4865743-Pyramimonas_sp.AAC.1